MAPAWKARLLIPALALAIYPDCFPATAQRSPAEIEQTQHEWESEMAEPVVWEPLTILDATSRDQSIKRAADGSLRVPAGDCRIEARTALRAITAFRLEIRSDYEGVASAAVISEFQVAGGNLHESNRTNWLRFRIASASSARPGHGADKAIDGDMRTGWAFDLGANSSQAAVFELRDQLEFHGPPVLKIHLRQAQGGVRDVFRVRIFATAKRPPVRELPGPIREALALEPTERTADQRSGLRAFFLSLSQPASVPKIRK
jgi:hypothetical protein